MKYIFKHSEKIEISEIVDNEANKLTTLLFKMHKIFCNNCRDIFESYQTLDIKLNEVYDKKLATTATGKVYNLYSATLKVAVYASVVGIVLTSTGVAFAQTQTDVDIIPDVTFFEDGKIISFSEEEVENFFTEVIDPVQATLITFIEQDEITVEEVTIEIEEKVEVLTTVVVDEEAVVVDEEAVETLDFKNALTQIDKNIALAIENNNSDALNGLENARLKIVKNIEKAEEKLIEGNKKAEEKIQEGNEKAQKEIEEATDKAEKILSKIKNDADEREVVKARLKAERTLEKAEEKAEEELEKAQEKAEEELEKAQEKAEEELEKAQKEAEEELEKAQKEAEESNKKDK